MNADNFKVAVYKHDIQREGGVGHPETPRLFIVKDEQHAVVGRQAADIHQSLVPFLFLVGNGGFYRGYGISVQRHKGYFTIVLECGAAVISILRIRSVPVL